MYTRRTLIAPHRVFNMKIAGWNRLPCVNPVSYIATVHSDALKQPSTKKDKNTKKLKTWDDHPTFMDDINKEHLIKRINETGWKFNSKTKLNYEDYDSFTLSEIMFIMEIGNSCRSFNKPHTIFKKMMKTKTNLGIAGPGNAYWKKTEKGLIAHRIYDQLFKLSKKKSI